MPMSRGFRKASGRAAFGPVAVKQSSVAGMMGPRLRRDLRKTSAPRRNVSRLTLARRCVLYGRDGDSRKHEKFPSLENFYFAARGNGVASAKSRGAM